MDLNAQREFWRWFKANEQAIYDFSPGQSPADLLVQLGEQLRAVDLDICFELGPKEGLRRSFFVSANGVRELFAEVQSLIANAPSLERWSFIAFRQRKPLEEAQLLIGEQLLEAKEVRCALDFSLRRVDVTLYLPNVSDENALALLEPAFLLLDAAIGEFDVAKKVGEVKLQNIELAPETSFNFLEFPKRFCQASAAYAQLLEEREALNAAARREVMKDDLAKKMQKIRESAGYSFMHEGNFNVDFYFLARKAKQRTELLNALQNIPQNIVEEIDYSSVLGEVIWVHCWLEFSAQQVGELEPRVQQMFELGLKFQAELEEVYVSRAEQTITLDELFGELDVSPHLHAAVRAHEELSANNPRAAAEILEEVLQSDAEEEHAADVELRGLLAYCYAKLGRGEAARETLCALSARLADDPSFPSTLWNMACSYSLLQETVLACELLQRAFTLDSGLRELAAADPDFAAIRESQEFRALMYHA